MPPATLLLGGTSTDLAVSGWQVWPKSLGGRLLPLGRQAEDGKHLEGNWVKMLRGRLGPFRRPPSLHPQDFCRSNLVHLKHGWDGLLRCADTGCPPFMMMASPLEHDSGYCGHMAVHRDHHHCNHIVL